MPSLKIGLTKLSSFTEPIRLNNNNFVYPIKMRLRYFWSEILRSFICFDFRKKMKSWKRELKKVVKNLKQQSVLYQNNLHELFRPKIPVVYLWVCMKNHDLRSVVPKLFSSGSALCFKTRSEMSHCEVKLSQKIPRGLYNFRQPTK